MKRSRFTDEQIIGILKEHAAGLSTTVRMLSLRPIIFWMLTLSGISATHCNWFGFH